MTFARRLLIVGSDHRFNQTVQTHIHKTFLLTAPVVRAEDLANLVTRETDGVLLFLATEPSDYEWIEASVREHRLQGLPPKMIVLETEELSLSRRFDLLVPHLEGTFVWSAQLRDLNTWIRRSVTQGTPFIDPANENTSDRVRRKLLALTPSLTHLCDQLDIAASHDVTVLIEGETGTGKTHLAKLIHDCSSRGSHRFMVVACGTLSGNLIASEFFGHEKGSFTGADTSKVGKFAAAGQGTLLLDEIDTLGVEHQANLLRVIETGEFEPVGSNETQICQARIIAATNWNLGESVDRGAFRRDLYYRLQVITFHLPPLRARPQDIGPLVRGMAAKYSTRFHKRIFGIDADALRAIEQFPWPGNIRQLENVIQQAVLTCTGEWLTLANLPATIQTRPTDGRLEGSLAGSLAQNRETTERAVIIRALEKVSFSRTRAAQLLGVSRVTLYKKMKKYGLLTKPNGMPSNNYETASPRV
ncbi:MAG: sigma 54-interacting transcriptional regulator [Fimbriiglobus sp.]